MLIKVANLTSIKKYASHVYEFDNTIAIKNYRCPIIILEERKNYDWSHLQGAVLFGYLGFVKDQKRPKPRNSHFSG